MVEPLPAVALLFDDAELGGQLRDALHECGARIVHEGGLTSYSRELQQRLDADVLVVNLDEGNDDALDQLYDMFDGDRPRLIFNEAQVSRKLAGWDRARWARHLAAKVLTSGDLDPPRPHDAPTIAEPAPAIEPPAMPVTAETSVAAEPPQLPEPVALAEPVVAWHDETHSDTHAAGTHVASENLEAELAAMLAAGGSLDEPEPVNMPSPPRQELPLHDDDFLAHAESLPVSSVVPPPLPPMQPSISVKAPQAPDSWSLLDDDALVTELERNRESERGPATFGVEKLSAADFLAPDVEQAAPDEHAVMSLELVSMEEAVAPQAWQPHHEMVLEDLDNVPTRVVLMGAAIDGLDAVCAFLATLPASSKLTFLHTQHFGAQAPDALLAKLAAHCPLPIRMAAHGSRARSGQVLVVPAGQNVQLRRDGSVHLLANESETSPNSSIDASFTMAAGVYGRDALAIVFAGRATDAVAGSQAIHDRGGQVWVESSSGEHFADMVSGILAERLVSYSGTPQELAAHLIEVYP